MSLNILFAKDMRVLEAELFKRHPDEDLAREMMDRVGRHISAHLRESFADVSSPSAYLLVGPGNNGGDALVAGRLLQESGWSVLGLEPDHPTKPSRLCNLNRGLFVDAGGKLKTLDDDQSHDLPTPQVIIDGLFGTGFRPSMSASCRSLCALANRLAAPTYAIDIPSGIGDESGIVADATFALQTAKTEYFLDHGWERCGRLLPVDFGLEDLASSELAAASWGEYLLASSVAHRIPKWRRTDHKYQRGVVYVVGGPRHMSGAAILAASAAVRAGAGLVRLGCRLEDSPFYARAPVEVVLDLMESQAHVAELAQHASSTDVQAVVVGPGLGTDADSHRLLESICGSVGAPIVLDADALTLFANQPFGLKVPTIMTPHLGELRRLLRCDHLPPTLDLVAACRRFTSDHDVVLVVKGAPTFVVAPGQPVVVSGRGDPGMATAGSGDVLAGIIGALLAQGASPTDAATAGVYLHQIAGEIAASDLSSYSVSASDLVACLGKSFLALNVGTRASV